MFTLVNDEDHKEFQQLYAKGSPRIADATYELFFLDYFNFK